MLNGKYLQLAKRLNKHIPSSRLLHDDLSVLAFGTDASFYRLLPQLVVKAETEAEVIQILQECSTLELAVTFRAAGTSLSGQAISDDRKSVV